MRHVIDLISYGECRQSVFPTACIRYRYRYSIVLPPSVEERILQSLACIALIILGCTQKTGELHKQLSYESKVLYIGTGLLKPCMGNPAKREG